MITLPPIWQHSIVMNVSVCLSIVGRYASISPEVHIRSSPIGVDVTYGRGSVLLWRRSDICAFPVFLDDVKFGCKPRLLDVAPN